MDAADLSPIPESQRTQPAFDLFLIFLAANIVATTLQTGAVLASRYGGSDAILLVVLGALFGSLLVALLAPVGSRFGVPSMIAARDPLGLRGAQLVSGLLYLTNFAWIAVNNTIAASVCAQLLGGSAAAGLWSAAVGVLATVIVARGPRAVGLADRIAVPLMAIAGFMLTWAAVTLPMKVDLASTVAPPSILWLPCADEQLEHRVEFAIERRILDEAAAVREHRVRRAGRRILDRCRIQQPASRGHRAAGIAALFDQAPEIGERGRAGKDAAHADDGDGFGESGVAAAGGRPGITFQGRSFYPLTLALRLGESQSTTRNSIRRAMVVFPFVIRIGIQR